MKMGLFWSVFWMRTGPERLVRPFQKILAEAAFKKAMNLDTMAVVHSTISAYK